MNTCEWSTVLTPANCNLFINQSLVADEDSLLDPESADQIVRALKSCHLDADGVVTYEGKGRLAWSTFNIFWCWMAQISYWRCRRFK
jgi:hypothetical protein